MVNVHRSSRAGSLAVAILCLTGCAVGPDYRPPAVPVPDVYKESVGWQPAQANPQGSLSSTWWLEFHDDELTALIERALRANQSLIAAEAAYRLAQASVSASAAALYPTVSASAAATRAGYGSAAAAATNAAPGVYHYVTAGVSASWELDLWGKTRRQLESSRALAQASDAQRAGQRLSIAASLASDYFALRQADADIELLDQQQRVYGELLAVAQAAYAAGGASGDDVLIAQDSLEAVIAALQATRTQREQYEHAVAVLVGVTPSGFTVEPRTDYAFVTPALPLSLPSQLLERRYDVVIAERQAAAANAQIGAAEAAYFPTLDLAAQDEYVHNQFAHLFSLPNRFWTLGPDLAATLFDGGARRAAVREAQARSDEAVATYRQTVLTAFQNVEDALSAWNHLQQQTAAYTHIYQHNQQLFDSTRAQRELGTASEENLLGEQLTLLSARQSLLDSQAALTQGSVALIRNLGGGWRWDGSQGTSAATTPSAGAASPAEHAAP